MKPTSVILLPLLLGVLLINAPTHAAKLYKWVDEQGRVTYQDRPPPEDSKFSETALSESETADPALKTYQDKMTAAAAKSPLVFFAIPDCDGCDLIRSYLEKRNIPFEEKNAEKDTKIQQELRELAGRLEVPLLVVGERVLRGYSKPVLESELDSAGFPKVEEKPDGLPKPEPRIASAPGTPTAEPNAEAETEQEQIDFDKLTEPATDDDIFKAEPDPDSKSGNQGGS